MHYFLISKNILTILEIRKNCLRSRRNLLLHLFMKRVIKLTVVIIEVYHCYQLNIKFSNTCLNFNSIRRRNYWGSSVWFST